MQSAFKRAAFRRPAEIPESQQENEKKKKKSLWGQTSTLIKSDTCWLVKRLFLNLKLATSPSSKQSNTFTHRHTHYMMERGPAATRHCLRAQKRTRIHPAVTSFRIWILPSLSHPLSLSSLALSPFLPLLLSSVLIYFYCLSSYSSFTFSIQSECFLMSFSYMYVVLSCFHLTLPPSLLPSSCWFQTFSETVPTFYHTYSFSIPFLSLPSWGLFFPSHDTPTPIHLKPRVHIWGCVCSICLSES